MFFHTFCWPNQMDNWKFGWKWFKNSHILSTLWFISHSLESNLYWFPLRVISEKETLQQYHSHLCMFYHLKQSDFKHIMHLSVIAWNQICTGFLCMSYLEKVTLQQYHSHLCMFYHLHLRCINGESKFPWILLLTISLWWKVLVPLSGFEWLK